MRILFKKGEQKKFLDKILAEMSVSEAAKTCDLSERTIRDWRREKFLPNENALHKLCKKSKIYFPKNIEFKNDYWYVSHSSSLGGRATYKKYGRIGGDPKYRKKKWREWWKNKGRFRLNSICLPKSIQKPGYSVDLAEFVGIVMGDGNITKRQITITLHSKDDKEYGKFVVTLIKRLFDVPTGTYYRKRDSIINFVISRTELVKFCTERLELKIGNKVKQQIDIPDWIKRNKDYAIACVRGLIDTDGSVFTHRYKVNGKWYKYKKLAFTSYSEPLRQSVFDILKENGLNPRLAQKRDVRLDSIKDMQTYFQLIGFHNPKHLKRYKK